MSTAPPVAGNPSRPFRKLQLAVMKVLLRTLGRTSDGIRIAFEHGLISGVMLEYVYRNQAGGSWLIGKWIDRAYLDHLGWQVIRARKANLEGLLARAIEGVRDTVGEPRVLDVAAGPSRYLLEVLSRDGMEDVIAVARDVDEEALGKGRANAKQMGLDERVRFEVGDALDRDSLATVQPAPNVVVSSGFYDWITEDDLIRKSMALIAERLPAGGYFVFTNQSGHSDLEMAEALFLDLKGQPLRMTTRPPATMNGWAEEAGFEVLATLSDEHGHYSATLARRQA